ncbi:MAG TPA: AlkA N-terminal domain-containing protein, partial [Marmoricola sp.]
RLPYAADPLVRWLGHHVAEGVEEVDAIGYRRVLPSGAIAGLRIEAGGVTLTTAVEDVRAIPDAVTRCRRLVDADADPGAVDEILGRDKLLAAMVRRRPGLRVPGSTDGFELLVRTILAQQVSLRAANTFAARLAAAYGKPLDAPSGSLTTRFPTSDALAEAALDGVGLTTSRQTSVRAAAAAHASGELVLDPSADRDATRAQLLALPGVGPWTAEYVAMRALGDPDAFPGSDLVLRRRVDPAHAERWRPWRSYAAMHIWSAHIEKEARP